MPSAHRTVTVFHRQGLHARPAALFVQVAKRYDARITVKKGRRSVDGKSIMGLLTLAAKQGARISIVVDGPDAEHVLDRLSRLLSEALPDSSGSSAAGSSRHPS